VKFNAATSQLLQVKVARLIAGAEVLVYDDLGAQVITS
jgi:siroheme synthase